MRNNTRVFSFLFIASTWLIPRPSYAQTDQPRSASLSWVRLAGAESCISSQKLARRVEEQLGRQVFLSASDAELSIEAWVKPLTESRGWGASITVSEPSGRILGIRRLETKQPNCDALNDQLVVVIALAIDPERAFLELPRHLSPEPDDDTDPAEELLAEIEAGSVERDESNPEPDIIAPSPAADPTRHRKNARKKKEEPEDSVFRFGVNAGAVIGLGLLPGLGFGLEVSGRVHAPRFWPVELSGVYFFENDTDSVEGGRGHLQVVQGTLAVCPLSLDISVGELYACAGGQIDLIVGRATSTDERWGAGEREYLTMFGVEAYSRLILHAFHPFHIYLGAAVAALVPGREFKINRSEADGGDLSLFRTSPVAGRLESGLGVRF